MLTLKLSFYLLGNPNIVNTTLSISDWLFFTQLRVLWSDWLILDNNGKVTALFIIMPFCLFSVHSLNWYSVDYRLYTQAYYGVMLKIGIFSARKVLHLFNQAQATHVHVSTRTLYHAGPSRGLFNGPYHPTRGAVNFCIPTVGCWWTVEFVCYVLQFACFA